MKTIDQPTQVVDEVIAEVRRHKLAIAEEHNFDIESLLRSLQARQSGDHRIVNLTKGELPARRESKSE